MKTIRILFEITIFLIVIHIIQYYQMAPYIPYTRMEQLEKQIEDKRIELEDINQSIY
jgi:hypothetical protein